MEVFDTHIHSEGRSVEDIAKMAEEGIKKAITCAFYPIQPKFPETLIDLFRKLTTFEVERGKSAGMEIYPAIGIHPRCIPPNYRKVIEHMEMECVAFGEIGLETGSDLEVEVLEEQLKLAKELDKPCIIHTPRKNKLEVTKKTIEILQKLEFPEDLAVIDHVSRETVKIVLDSGYYAGLTVQPGKLSEEDVYSIVSEFGVERFVINSDTGFDNADMFATTKTVKTLMDKGIAKDDVKKLAMDNGLKIFRIKGL
jgi:predicted metal-dependent TIM-barrel fold hydrolase